MQDQQIRLEQPFKQKKQKGGGFAQYSFMYELYKAVMVNGLKTPTPVQKKTIPVLAQGKDAIVCYKTGSGKTLAYLLPMINKLKCHSKIVGARALIIIPTKDLAEQITKVLKLYIKFTDLRYSLILGGHTFEGQFESLTSNPDIIIATPGRLMQLLVQAQQKLLGRVETVIFDQADNLFQGGFQSQLKQILQRCPVSQRVMLSATINDKLNEFASTCLRQYSYIHQEISLPDTMSVDFLIMRPQQKLAALLFFLDTVTKSGKIMVFTATRYHVDYLLAVVSEFYECYGIYGQMDMDQRIQSLQKFKKKKNRSILIVTDVAARGLDIPSVQYVLHFDYPTNHKTFVHRSGRTARKGESGSTYAFVTHNEISYMTELSSYVGRTLTNESNAQNAINYGCLPTGLLDRYAQAAKRLKEDKQQLTKLDETANRAFDKFKRCRTETSQNSIKKARALTTQVHHQFKQSMEDDQREFLSKIHNFTPKKSFLQLQKINMELQPENDAFLAAVQRIRKDQNSKKQIQLNKDKLRQRNSKRWQEILTKDEMKSLEKYKNQMNSKRLPISIVNGVEIEIVGDGEKKSSKRDYRNQQQYISDVKPAGFKSEFDDLPRIKNNEIDDLIHDQNPRKNNSKRVWDKMKKDFVWKRDKEDRVSKEQKGKKAYQKWKKQSKLAIPKVGQMENENQTQQAKQRWVKRRKFRHGWKENVEKTKLTKNNKTKAIQKKYKKKMIKNSQKGKGKGKSHK